MGDTTIEIAPIIDGSTGLVEGDGVQKVRVLI